MNKFIKYFLFSFAFVVVGLLVGFKLKGNFSRPTTLSNNKEIGYQKLRHAIDFISKNYVKDESSDELVDQAIKGIMEQLDPHSFYISSEDRARMDEEMEGSYDGIGIEFNLVDDTIFVEYPIPGGPSEKAGILNGDRILSANSQPIAGIGIKDGDVQKYLKGPRGTDVEVDIYRKETGEIFKTTITRGPIPLNSVSFSYMITPEIGYIKVIRFAETTYKEFREHLAKLLESGMQNLILDLRSNPGGYMTMANQMADEFLSEGKLIVSTEGRIERSKQKYESTSAIGAFEDGGLIVLIDYGSASASEIVAGAVQDHDRGLIVGVRSFGKGLVQIQEEFEDGSAIRLVISEYYTPSGRCIQKPYDAKSSYEYEHEIADRFESGEIFDQSKIKLPDSLKFKTAAGRTVYGGGGIYPDVFVSNDTTGGSYYYVRLNEKDIFRDFSAYYVESHPELKNKYIDGITFSNEFELSNAIVDEFIDFASTNGVKYIPQHFQDSRALILNRLKAYMGRRMFNDDGFYPVFYQRDKVLQEALGMMDIAITLENTGKLELPE